MTQATVDFLTCCQEDHLLQGNPGSWSRDHIHDWALGADKLMGWDPPESKVYLLKPFGRTSNGKLFLLSF